MESVTIGIDLGTTHSAVAVRRLESEVLANDQGEFLTPSCVYLRESSRKLEEANVVVGKKALNWRKQEPDATVTHIKRLMGRNFLDENVQNIIKKKLVGYQIKRSQSGSDDSLAVAIPSRTEKGAVFEFSPEEISSAILRKLKQDAEREIGSEVNRAIITVPAYFNDKQRHVTLVAAKLAGFSDCHLLPEPSAAAIAFGIDEQRESLKTIVVFDFGGGTLDISVLTLAGQRVVEQGKSGDMWLGGKDIDQALVKYLFKKAESEDHTIRFSQILKNMSDGKALQALLEMESLAEEAKIRLGSQESTRITVAGIFEEDGLPLDFEILLTKKELNSVVSPMINRSVQLTSDLLKELNLTPSCIDDILLVGGSSQLDAVKEGIQKIFEAKKIHSHPRPMLAIVEGAAIYSQYKLESSSAMDSVNGQTTALQDILFTSAHDYFLKVPSDDFPPVHLVKKNAPLPITKEVEIKLHNKKQRLIQLQFLNLVNSDYEVIGRLWLSLNNLSEFMLEQIRSAANLPILVLKIQINENNLISVGCCFKEFSDVQIQHSISRGKVNEQLYLRLEEGIQSVNRETDIWIKVDYEERATFIVQDINNILNNQTETVNLEIQKKAERKLKTAEELSRQKESIFPNIWYLKTLLLYCRGKLSSNESRGKLKELGQQLKLLERANLDGDPNEIVRVNDDIYESFKRHFPVGMSSFDFISNMEDGKRLNMHKEVEEISALISEPPSSEKSRRVGELMDKIQEGSSREQYAIDTGFTLS